MVDEDDLREGGTFLDPPLLLWDFLRSGEIALFGIEAAASMFWKLLSVDLLLLLCVWRLWGYRH